MKPSITSSTDIEWNHSHRRYSWRRKKLQTGAVNPGRTSLVDDRPEAPEGIIVEQAPDGVLVTWTPMDGASEYQVIYDDQLSRMCHLGWPEQELLQCREAGRTADTSFLHQSSSQLQAKYYWVAACNQAGCRKGKGKGVEIGDPTEQSSQVQQEAVPSTTGSVTANLTLSRQSVREGENFTVTLEAQAPSSEPGTLNLRINADGPLHVTFVAGQESCGPSCVNLVHKTAGDGRGSLSASFTAGQRGTAKLLWDVKWEPDGEGEYREGSGERTLVILARHDSPNPFSTAVATPAPASPATGTTGGGCNSFADSTGPGSLALLALLILPVAGLVARPLLP